MELPTIGGVAPDRVPDPVQIAALREIRKKTVRQATPGIVAIVISLCAAGFTGWQAYESREARIAAREDARTARQDAKDAATQARKDSQAAIQLQLETAKASQAQAERSAKAAEASASAATLSLHISERAYLDVDAGVTSSPKTGEKLSFRSMFTNSGRTPAREVVTNSRSGFVAASATPEQAHSMAFGPAAQVPAYTSKGVLAPTAKFQTTWQTLAPLTQGEVDALTNHVLLIYVFAIVTYKDEFQRSHKTSFCGYFDPAALAGMLLQCSSLNTAD